MIMPMRIFRSIKFKIIAATLICVAVVSLISNTVLYRILNELLNAKASAVQQVHLSTMQIQMNHFLERARTLMILSANDSVLASSIQSQNITSDFLKGQSQLDTYLKTFVGHPYVGKLFVFHKNGMILHASTKKHGQYTDVSNVLRSPIFLHLQQNPSQILLCEVTGSIQGGEPVIAMLTPMRLRSGHSPDTYLYMELALSVLTDTLKPYESITALALADVNGTWLSPLPAALTDMPQQSNADVLISEDGTRWSMQGLPLAYGGLSVFAFTPQSFLAQESLQLLYTVLMIFATGLLLAGLLAALLSTYLTKPIQRLNHRLQKITANDFSYDPNIEQSRDEIGEIGCTVNQMTMSIHHLLEETQQMYEEKKNIEISMLQSQVNPHFLYNTLDSIRWMAVIQKCPGIASMTANLVNLLKNIAKGTQDHIPLSDETALLEDYIAIQSVRYLDTFTFQNLLPKEFLQYRIIKFTLQPLVENAIFHGIEPTGECGTVSLQGYCEGDDLILVIEDNGVGMSSKKIEQILKQGPPCSSNGSLNGIGVANVHRRLQLTYGEQYGLSIESRPGSFTRVCVRIPKEK